MITLFFPLNFRYLIVLVSIWLLEIKSARQIFLISKLFSPDLLDILSLILSPEAEILIIWRIEWLLN